MSARIIYKYVSTSSISVSVERLYDGKFFDFNDGIFKTSPGARFGVLTEQISPYVGIFRRTITPTLQKNWPDGEYAVYIHNTANSNSIIDVLSLIMLNGDDVNIPADPKRNLGYVGTVNDATPSEVSFITEGLPSDINFVDMTLVFESGELVGQKQRVVQYSPNTKRIILTRGFRIAPIGGNRFRIV